jgi:mannose-6-phosphate isomerase-like protein (cupin superfamily)
MTAASYQALTDIATIAWRAAAAQPFAPRAELDRAVTLLSGLSFAGQASPRSHGVVERHLRPRAVRHRHAGALLDTLLETAPAIDWIGGDSGYGGEPGMEAFCANYAFCALAGPARWATGCSAVSDEVGFNFTVQGPGVTYPDHAHKAIELYYVVSGKALWKRGDEPWVERYPGEVILHTAGMRHAMKTADEPLVAMAVWISDIQAPLVVVRA